MLLVVPSCTDDLSDPSTTTTAQTEPQAVSFGASLPTQRETRSRAKLPTRAASDFDWTGKGYRGLMTQEKLRQEGFGVFAHYSGRYHYYGENPEHAPALTGGTPWPAPNFMYNQHVTWDDVNSYWTYTPVKYWPNESQEGAVDDQEPPATTDYQNGGFVSFFAYAPYLTTTDPSTGATYNAAGTGIQSFTPNSGSGYHPNLGYEIATHPNRICDVLLGLNPKTGFTNGNLTKQKVNQYVDFKFIHATAQVRLTMQGVFNAADPTGDDLDGNTQIMLNDVRISGPFPTHAQLTLWNGEPYLESLADTWDEEAWGEYWYKKQFPSTEKNQPYWSFQTHKLQGYVLLTAEDVEKLKEIAAKAVGERTDDEVAFFTLYKSVYDEIKAWLDDNPEATEEEKADYIETYLVNLNNSMRIHSELTVERDTPPMNRFTEFNHDATDDESNTYKGGITEVEKNIFTGLPPEKSIPEKSCLLFIPTYGYKPSDVDYTVKVHYTVITTDPSLPGGKSQTDHYVEDTLNLTLKANTIYNLKMLVGFETLGFDVVEKDWTDGDSDKEVWMPTETH